MKKINVGDKVPDFSLFNQDGKRISIADYFGKPMVIYFYPKDNTAGCTKQACSFRNEFDHFSSSGTIIFGISSDNIATHMKFKSKNRLPFDLLSDKHNEVRNLFGVPADLFGLLPGRVTYVIDRQGIVRHIFNNQYNVNKHIEEAIKIIDELP